ncbi:MAG: hypothetical protein HKP61_08420 [Dactylosporangium sp.]|nr:hypothetical protein [Dactylosporangium sp.]NNJ60961.1 hypothetical protein [Dactylosporangium sp.]
MQLTFLGKETQGGGSPTLFATDRYTYVVQGWKVPDRTTSVEIPSGLLVYVEHGSELGAVLTDTGRDSFILSGAAVTDTETLAQMDIPGHETCVEVGKARKDGTNGTASG